MATITEVLLTDMAHIADFVRASTGDQDKISGLLNLKHALFHRLLTVPGSLIHRPDYGVGVKLYQNSINSIANQQKLALRIRENFQRDGRIEEVSGISFSFESDRPETVTIKVRVKVKGYQDPAAISFKPFQSEVD